MDNLIRIKIGMNLAFKEIIVMKYPHDSSWFFAVINIIFSRFLRFGIIYTVVKDFSMSYFGKLIPGILNSFYLILKISLCAQHFFILWTFDVIFSSLKLKDLLFDHDLIAFLTICIFQLLIETMWADFNKTLNTSSFDEGISNYSSPKDPERKRNR